MGDSRRYKIRALLLVAPLLLFLLVTYIVPLANIFYTSVDNSVLAEYMPQSATALSQWSGEHTPNETLFNTVGHEIKQAYENHTLGRVANHLNYIQSGMRSFITRTGRSLASQDTEEYQQAMIAIDPRWGEYQTWETLKKASPRFTISNYLASLDLRYSSQDGIVLQEPEQAIYARIFWRTLWVSFIVTLICLILGFPVAYLMANLPLHLSNWLMILVLLPFWTSLLVRTVSWIVLLQSSGVLNNLMVWMGIIDDDNRIQMIFNLTGTIVVMSYILLPFMILPLYSVMKTVPKSLTQVAVSLGANPIIAFIRIYLPQVLPGIGAGSLLVFMLAVGYYITPALVGGQSGQLISNFIAYHITTSLNWGMAAAIGMILLIFVLLIYWLYSRIIGIEKMKLM